MKVGKISYLQNVTGQESNKCTTGIKLGTDLKDAMMKIEDLRGKRKPDAVTFYIFCVDAPEKRIFEDFADIFLADPGLGNGLLAGPIEALDYLVEIAHQRSAAEIPHRAFPPLQRSFHLPRDRRISGRTARHREKPPQACDYRFEENSYGALIGRTKIKTSNVYI